jgi:hypothetical protein
MRGVGLHWGTGVKYAQMGLGPPSETRVARVTSAS